MAVLVTIGLGSVGAQSSSTPISPAEYSEAKRIAKRFTRRFIQTKDIRPLIDEFFVKDFRSRLQRDNPPHWSNFFNDKKVPLERTEKLPQFFASEINWLWLSMLYRDSRPTSSGEDDEADPFADLPVDVRQVLEEKKPLYEAMFVDDLSPIAENIDKKSIEYFDESLELLDETIPMLRKAAVKIGAGKTSAWRDNSSSVEKWMKAYEPWIYECRDDCMGFEEGRRMIRVNIPYFQITMVRVGKHLRVVKFYFYID